ncbi:MAG TPA: prepilin-type N-terminal cleavage/methylation domain-containing protein [Terriglobia bacterium]|nr:prepilin-type N-terminal cleavage/methylation domain-containing protein [Terriglobia bacterium]
MSQSVHKPANEKGISLLEVLVSIVILTVAMLGSALLAARLMNGQQQTKYMSLASTLASEKLEDLNRWSANDPPVCVPTGNSSVGSLTTDVVQTTTCPAGASDGVNYYDDVYLGATNGSFSETISSVSGGSTVYTTTTHAPDGTVTSSTSPQPPQAPTFHRRWIIEMNAPVNGVRRVTVLVTLLNGSVQVPAQFQMSLVRP